MSEKKFYVDKNLLSNFFSIESFTIPKSEAWIQTQRNWRLKRESDLSNNSRISRVGDLLD